MVHLHEATRGDSLQAKLKELKQASRARPSRAGRWNRTAQAQLK